jgi:hypothetical protein
MVTQNVLNLKLASEKLKNDKEVVLKTVSQAGWSLEFVSKEFQNDKDVVLKAVAQ